MRLTLLAATVVTATLAACGGGSAPTNPPSATDTPASTPTVETVTPTPDPSTPSPSTPTAASSSSTSLSAVPGSFTFKYVAPDGWHYSGVITWPAMFHFSKDVSNSPPGEAALKVTEIPLADGLVQSYTNTDRGRSGPELAVQPGTFGWHIAHLAKADPTGLVKAPDCQSFGTPSYNSRPQEDPQDVDLLCDVLPGPLFTQNDPPWVISGPSVREKTVNAFLKNVAAYPYVWLTKIHDCDIWFYTNGKVVKPNWGDCGKFTITK